MISRFTCLHPCLPLDILTFVFRAPMFPPMMFVLLFAQGTYVCRPEHTTAKFALARLILRKSGKICTFRGVTFCLCTFDNFALNTLQHFLVQMYKGKKLPLEKCTFFTRFPENESSQSKLGSCVFWSANISALRKQRYKHHRWKHR